MYVHVHAYISRSWQYSRVHFRGFDSIIILVQRSGILMSIGDFPEHLSQAMLAGIFVSREIVRIVTILAVRTLAPVMRIGPPTNSQPY